MTNAAQHRAVFFATDAQGSLVWDANDQAVVERIVECDDLCAAQRMVREAVQAAGTHSAASLSVAVELFAADDLAAYIDALNFGARLLEEMPREGAYISKLTDDLSYWAEDGVKTPQNLADYLDGCFAREMQKAAMA